jgi:hypothetical protein
MNNTRPTTAREAKLNNKRNHMREARALKHEFESRFAYLDMWVNCDSFIVVADTQIECLLAKDPHQTKVDTRKQLERLTKWLNLVTHIRQLRCLEGDCPHGDNCGYRDVLLDTTNQLPPQFHPGTNTKHITQQQSPTPATVTVA